MAPSPSTNSRFRRLKIDAQAVLRLLSLSIILICVGLASPAQAQLIAEPKALSFGEQGHSASVERELVIKNEGSTAITVERIRPSCSCTKVVPPAITAPIAPGASVRLHVTMNGGRAMGELKKYIEFTTKAQGALRVPVSMRIHPRFRMKPREIRFDGVVGGEPVVQRIEISAKDGKAFTLGDGIVTARFRSAARPAEHFKVAVVESAQGRAFEVTLLPTHPEGRIWGELVGSLDGKKLVVPIAGQMFRGVKVVPTYFNFSRVKSDDPKSWSETSTLSSTDGRAFEILEIQSKAQTLPPGVVLEVRKSKNAAGDQWTLEATLVAKPGGRLPTSGRLSGEVTVRTDHPEKPTVLLKYFGLFVKPGR